jgi:penicillin amidase
VKKTSLLRRSLLISASIAGLIVLALGADVAYIANGVGASSQLNGTLTGLSSLSAPVHVYRDERGVPHLRASNLHDLCVAQGYVEGADRLFQMDLLRRAVYGRLSEFFGTAMLEADETARTADLRRVLARQWERLDAPHRDEIVAFTAGVNAARVHEPVPFEYRILHLSPEPWTATDTLAAGFATAIVLTDPWQNVIARAAISHNDPKLAALIYPLSDPKFDVHIAGASPAAAAPLPSLADVRAHLRARHAFAAELHAVAQDREASNDWAVGAAHSVTGRALLANDPHLQAHMPGVWYLIEMQAGSFHVAGATLTGAPGVTLGHNDAIAWGVTNGTTCSESVYADSTAGEQTRSESFNVRFGAPVTKTYARTKHGFVAAEDGHIAYAVDWSSEANPVTPLLAFDALAHAGSIARARAALALYTGPTQNFVLADRGGQAAYQLAGPVPNDPLWCLGVHPASDPHYPLIAPAALPAVNASREAIVYTANDQMYGTWPQRLSAQFAPPYRAARIAAALKAKPRFSLEDFAALQNETISLPDAELAREAVAAVDAKHAQEPSNRAVVEALRRFDGSFAAASTDATVAAVLRAKLWGAFDAAVAPDRAADYYESAGGADMSLMLRVLRERPKGWIGDYDAFLVEAVKQTAAGLGGKSRPWSTANQMLPKHPFALLGLSMFNGVPFPGRGTNYTLRVQFLPSHAQSFRAVWEAGNWDAGGITIPEGESGRPGSGHYTDASADWNGDRLVPLPYSDAAVRKAARHDLTLAP